MLMHNVPYAALAMYLVIGAGYAESPRDLQSVQAPKSLDISVSVPYARLVQLFKYPICTEHPRLYRVDGSASSNIESPPNSETITVERNESLSHVIDRLIASAPEEIERKDTNGFISILYDKNALNASPDEITTMDRRITFFQVDSMSTWDALKTLALQINSLPDSKYPFIVQPVGTGKYDSHKPPISFTQDIAISLSMRTATIREIITAILAASPSSIYYDYSPTDSRDSLMIYFLIDDSTSVPAPPSLADVEFWEKEIRDLSESFTTVHLELKP